MGVFIELENHMSLEKKEPEVNKILNLLRGAFIGFSAVGRFPMVQPRVPQVLFVIADQFYQLR